MKMCRDRGVLLVIRMVEEISLRKHTATRNETFSSAAQASRQRSRLLCPSRVWHRTGGGEKRIRGGEECVKEERQPL